LQSESTLVLGLPRLHRADPSTSLDKRVVLSLIALILI
jgi:hypothetical protein